MDGDTADDGSFHWCCRSGVKRLDNHWLLWGRPRSRFPMQGMIGPDWRVGMWTFLTIPAGTIGWACLILFVVPDNGDDLIAHIIVAIGAVLALIAMATYLSTACTDPGIVFKHMAPPMSGSLPTVGEAAGSFAAGVEGGGGDPGRGSWGTAVVAPAGAGTPVRNKLSTRDFSAKGEEGAGSVAAGGAGEQGGGDVEAQEMLAILTNGLHREDDQNSTSIAAVPAVGGLPPEECIAAADAGSTAVVDMRNAPPLEWRGRVPPGPLPASRSQNGASFDAGAEGNTVCGLCQIERPAGAIHCRRCGVCVRKLDHHCPFVGQCVGRKTLVSFYVFVVAVWCLVVYVMLGIAYVVVSVVINGL